VKGDPKLGNKKVLKKQSKEDDLRAPPEKVKQKKETEISDKQREEMLKKLNSNSGTNQS